jgi:hypothetical protein
LKIVFKQSIYIHYLENIVQYFDLTRTATLVHLSFYEYRLVDNIELFLM